MQTLTIPAAAILVSILVAAAGDPQSALRSGRGAVQSIDADSGVYQVNFEKERPGSQVELTADSARLLRCYAVDDPSWTPLSWTFAADGEAKSPLQMQVALPADFAERKPARRAIVAELLEKSGQMPDGRILLGGDAVRRAQAADRPQADRMILRPQWSEPSERLEWSYTATRPGRYVAELSYALAGEAGAENEIELTVGEQKLTAVVQSTGRNGAPLAGAVLSLGPVSIRGPGELAVSLGCARRGSSAAIVDALAIALRPACEGRPITQAGDGSVTCHARDVTIHGVQVQYEPKPEKNTVGFWTNPRDRVSWEFALETPGRFEVEILQGCGKGAGGSDVELSVDNQPLRFTVEDTGHFQNFVARKIGTVQLEKPGRHTVLVKPLRKAGVAVMDLRQVRLVPIP